MNSLGQICQQLVVKRLYPVCIPALNMRKGIVIANTNTSKTSNSAVMFSMTVDRRLFQSTFKCSDRCWIRQKLSLRDIPRQMTSTFKMTVTMVTLCGNAKYVLTCTITNGLTHLIVPADVHNLTAKVISTASAVLHAPVQMCLGALHCTSCVSVTSSQMQKSLLLSESSVNHVLFLLATVPLHIFRSSLTTFLVPVSH